MVKFSTFSTKLKQLSDPKKCCSRASRAENRSKEGVHGIFGYKKSIAHVLIFCQCVSPVSYRIALLFAKI